MAVQLLKKCGNSPAVRLPAAVMADAHLALDQAAEVRAEDGQVIIEPAGPSYALDDLLAGITPENRHAEQDFGPPQGRLPLG
jgi:antitoxin MazE